MPDNLDAIIRIIGKDETGGAVNSTLANLNRIKESEERYYASVARRNKSTNVDEVRAKFQAAAEAMKNATSAAETNRSGIERLATSHTNASRAADNTSASIVGLAGRFISIGAAVETARRAVGRFGDVDLQMRSLQVQSGLTRAEVDKMAPMFSKLADSSARSLDETIAGFNAFRKAANLSAKDAAAVFPSVAEGAAGAGIEISKAAEITGALMNNMKIGGGDVSRVWDVLIKANEKYGLTVDELAGKMPELTGAAQRWGYEGVEGLSRLSAYLGIVRKETGSTSEALGALSQLMDMGKSGAIANTVGIDKDLFRHEIDKALKNGGDPLMRFAQMVEGQLQNGRKLADFPKELQAPLSALLEKYRTVNASSKELKDSFGVAAEAAKIMTEGPAASAQRLKNNFDGLLTSVGGLLSVFTEIGAGPGSNWLKEMTGWAERAHAVLKEVSIIVNALKGDKPSYDILTKGHETDPEAAKRKSRLDMFGNNGSMPLIQDNNSPFAPLARGLGELLHGRSPFSRTDEQKSQHNQMLRGLDGYMAPGNRTGADPLFAPTSFTGNTKKSSEELAVFYDHLSKVNREMDNLSGGSRGGIVNASYTTGGGAAGGGRGSGGFSYAPESSGGAGGGGPPMGGANPGSGGGGGDAPRGDGRGTTGNASTGSMMNHAMDQLRREGVPEANLRNAAAHLVGQAQMESGLNPNLSHDGGTGYGIYGARNDRKTKMLGWMKQNGYAPNSAEGQMRYMAKEAMSGAYPKTKETLMSGAGAEGVGTITKEFERPAVNNDRTGAFAEANRVGPSESVAQENTAASQTGGAPPSDVINQARKIALNAGPGEVERFMSAQGYPRSGAWCGQFAASVVTSVGGKPPKNPQVASNWRNYGSAVDNPQPGDIAVRKGARTGSTGSHVTIVDSVNGGRFKGLGGNQRGGRISNFPTGGYEFRRGSAPEASASPSTAQAAPTPQPSTAPDDEAMERARQQREELAKPIPIRFERGQGDDQFQRTNMRRQVDRELRDGRSSAFTDLGAA
ncbi:MAG: hypothetical protein JWN75_1258 [Candidatus Saccharibacteria bacterium]|nr:hypothetical protein [Candidatus Saccharibacteria bacterium]